MITPVVGLKESPENTWAGIYQHQLAPGGLDQNLS